MQPTLGEIIRNQQKRVFSGQSEDFAAWPSEWENFVDVARSTSGEQALSDKLLLTILREPLDKSSKILPATKLRENPSLRYSEFMAGLEFGQGWQQNRRILWRKVAWIRPEGRVSFADWRNFKVALEAKLQGVEPPPPQEDLRDLITHQLPKCFQDMVVKEEIGRQKKSLW